MLALILEYRAEAQSIFSWLLCLAALVWGGGPERAIALVWLVLFKLVDAVYETIWGATFRPEQLDIFSATNDTLALVILVVVAVKANRMYPLWIAAFQVLATLSHFANAMAEHITPIAYVILAVTPGYFQLLLLTGGLYAHMRRARKHGTYRDWLGPMIPVPQFAPQRVSD
ncbi:MAG: hypothetical protein ABJ239_07020 [Erythrobacter sp.]